MLQAYFLKLNPISKKIPNEINTGRKKTSNSVFNETLVTGESLNGYLVLMEYHQDTAENPNQTRIRNSVMSASIDIYLVAFS